MVVELASSGDKIDSSVVALRLMWNTILIHRCILKSREAFQSCNLCQICIHNSMTILFLTSVSSILVVLVVKGVEEIFSVL